MIDIVIVNWNSGEMIRTVIDSIRDSSFKHTRVYVVDNQSADGSLQNIPWNGSVCIIKNPDNVGFGKACNQALEMCSSPYVLFLNPDTMLYPETLSSSHQFMEDHPEIAVMGCRHLDEHGKTRVSCSRFPQARFVLYDIIGLSKVFPRIFTPSTLMTDWDHESSKIVDQVMGAFMLVRRSILDHTGFFDPRFFMYFEDLDLSKRISTNNGLIFYNSEISIYHKGEGTTAQISGDRLFYFLQSRKLYLEKYFGSVTIALITLASVLIEPVTRTINEILHGKIGGLRNITHGYVLYIFWMLKRK